MLDLVGFLEGFGVEFHLELVAVMELGWVLVFVSFVVKEDDAVFKDEVAVDNPADDKLFLADGVFFQHGKGCFAVEFVQIAQNQLAKFGVKEAENFVQIHPFLNWVWGLNLGKGLLEVCQADLLAQLQALHEFMGGRAESCAGDAAFLTQLR